MANEKRLIDVERYVAGLNMSIADAQVKYAGDKVMEEMIGILRLVRDMAIHQPTVDAVEVVRCKDCKYRHQTVSGIKICQFHITMGAEDSNFCSYGERREGE